MSPAHRTTATQLAHAGMAPPWLALAVRYLTQWDEAGFAALGYGAVIASFVCGLHWGFFLFADQKLPVNLLTTSNVGALLAWLMLLLSPVAMSYGFAGLAVILLGLLAIDRVLLRSGLIEPWFWTVRRNATIGLGGAMLVWSVLA
jgi:hypothetical protein